jgi:hypothetical protein
MNDRGFASVDVNDQESASDAGTEFIRPGTPRLQVGVHRLGNPVRDVDVELDEKLHDAKSFVRGGVCWLRDC